MQSHNNLRNIILDGDVHPADEAVLSPFSRLAAYGEGCFDTVRLYSGYALRPNEHLHRLKSGMTHLGLALPPALQSAESFRKLLHRFLEVNDALRMDVRLRIQVWADDHTTGYRPGNRTCRYIITGSSVSAPTSPFVSLITSRVRRIPAASLPPDVKWSNGINYILAAREAEQAGADDALMLTQDGHLSETTIANIFWKRGDTVFTPARCCDLLPGITRGLLISAMKQAGWKVCTGNFLPHHLREADVVWACNSVREWYPVRELDGEPLGFDETAWDSCHALFEKQKTEELVHVC
ncbi:aminotransferase class IV [Balneolales bacterium ANBcel1]|nr:aminotransferase class IV [Balneolales bacterium ANBcel1]